MKTQISISRFAMAVVMAMVAALALAPVGVAQATMEPFSATGPVLLIDPFPDEIPAGDSGRFVVFERFVKGQLAVGNITGDYIITFGTNVPVTTQSGNIHGTLEVGTFAHPEDYFNFEITDVRYKARVSLKSELDFSSIEPVSETSTTCAGWLAQFGAVACITLTIDGVFTFIEDTAQGHGDVIGGVRLGIDAAGHVVAIDPYNSPLTFTGQWQP